MRAGSLKRFAVDLYNGISNHNVFNGAAALAYYLFLSIFPAVIILLSLLPYMPISHLNQAIMDLFGQTLPKQSADMFTGIVNSVVCERRGDLLSFSPAADKGREVLAEKVKPLINELGDTMKETLNRIFDSVNRDPLPVFLIGLGAGLVLLSLCSLGKRGGDGERLGFTDPGARVGEETEVRGEEKSGSPSFSSIKLGLSALTLAAAMSGLVPGLESEKVEGWRKELLAKAGEAGEEMIKGTEKMLRKKLNAEPM